MQTRTAISVLCLVVLVGLLLPGPSRAEDIGEELPQCVPTCENAFCGDDGCGGSCGECPPYHLCQGGACFYDGGCQPLAIPGCGNCTCEACVCQLDPYCCTGAWDALCVSRCNNQCGGCGQPLVCGDGTCHPGETCANCVQDCGSCPLGCGPVTAIGCCAENTLLQCQNGSLAILSCNADEEEFCGWLPDEGRYGCGGDGPDPAGLYPMVCDTTVTTDVVEVTPDPACQDVSFVGCCQGNTLTWCDGGGLHTLDCTANPAPFDQCGWNPAKEYYDCGGDGPDPSGANPLACPAIQTDLQEQDAVGYQCKVGTFLGEGCEGISWEGCCSEQGGLLFCEAGKYLCLLDCSGLVYPANTCGWHDGSPGYYDCGGQGADPNGDFPLLCPPVVAPEDVTIEDTAGPAKPTCTGVPDGGCCEGSILVWCENGQERTFDCASLASDEVFSAYLYCGANPTTGQADCLKKPDPSPPACNSGQVEPAPEPAPDSVASPDAQEVLEELLETLSPDLHEAGLLELPDSAVEMSGYDQGGIVIPGDKVEPEPPSKGDDGCTTGRGPGASATSLLLLLMAIFFLSRVLRSASGVDE